MPNGKLKLGHTASDSNLTYYPTRRQLGQRNLSR